MADEINNNTNQSTKPQYQTSAISPVQDIPQNTSLQNSNLSKFKKIIIGIIIVTITSLATSSFLFLSQKEQITQKSPKITVNPTINTAKPTLNPEETLKAPKLYSGFEWIEVDTNEANSMQRNLSKAPLLYVNYDPVFISIRGREWKYNSGTLNTFEEMYALREKHTTYYSNEASNFGWEQSVDYKNKRVNVIAADGPGGSLWGYVKIVEDKMRVIILQESNDEAVLPIPGCPCKMSFRVFVSEIFSTSILEN